MFIVFLNHFSYVQINDYGNLEIFDKLHFILIRYVLVVTTVLKQKSYWKKTGFELIEGFDLIWYGKSQ